MDTRTVVWRVKNQSNARMILNDDEAELLLMRGTRYRVTSWERTSDGVYYLDVEEF